MNHCSPNLTESSLSRSLSFFLPPPFFLGPLYPLPLFTFLSHLGYVFFSDSCLSVQACISLVCVSVCLCVCVYGGVGVSEGDCMCVRLYVCVFVSRYNRFITFSSVCAHHFRFGKLHSVCMAFMSVCVQMRKLVCACCST